MRHFRSLIFLCLLLSACAGPKQSGLFQNVREIRPDGKISAPLKDQELSPFQVVLRQSFPPQPVASLNLNPFAKRQPTAPSTQVWALEVDQPAGEGGAGGYLAIVRQGASTELRYYEQLEHRPRVDRFYHRNLSDEEVATWDALVQDHPLVQLRMFRPPVATAPAAPATTEPTDVSSAGSGAAESDGFTFRITDARQGQAVSATFAAPLDPPTAQLVDQLRHLRDVGGFACTYVRSIPLTARSMFADPDRTVVGIWIQDEDLRIAVSATADETSIQWLAYHAGRWEPSLEPGVETTTEPSAPEEILPEPAATQTAPASAPDPGPAWENPGMLPTAERWWTQPQPNATLVMHYVPVSPMYGVTHGFVVPGFLFDDAHCVVNPKRGMLYLIHDGQLFSLEIPAGAQ